jgi:hypothetical protein
LQKWVRAMKKRIRERVSKAKGEDTSDGGKPLSETSKSASGQCVGESSTGAKSAVIRTSVNIFEVSKRDKP